jgi:hypothetical protein
MGVGSILYTNRRSRAGLVLAAVLTGLVLASPAMAQVVGPVLAAEPSTLTLLGLGVVGVVVGRWAATKRPRDD